MLTLILPKALEVRHTYIGKCRNIHARCLVARYVHDIADCELLEIAGPGATSKHVAADKLIAIGNIVRTGWCGGAPTLRITAHPRCLVCPPVSAQMACAR